jgi:hypothetical protein
VSIRSSGAEGLRHGLITLAHLLEASAAGERLAPLVIQDAPAFRVRGVQIDLAREYYPPLPYLRKVVDRLADLKINTLWLYLENHFRAPGLEDLSPVGGLTPAEARAISAYGRERGIDVVPGTNVLSHMEGWLRLERYSELADGAARSYPVLSRPDVWPLVRRYLDALMEAFPSPNIQVGLDELLFTGTNPEAVKAIARAGGKAAYFARFAGKVARHVLARGKIPWIWDDMVMGKNVSRKEGFGDEYKKALAALPPQTIMTHWYYWTDKDGMHSPIIQRVAAEGRPFVVAPSAMGFSRDDCGSWSTATDNQRYMAGCGQKYGAFGLVNTHWESQYGSSFDACWPVLASGAGFAWAGGKPVDAGWERAFSFALCGDTGGALVAYLMALDGVTREFQNLGVEPQGFRWRLFRKGPQHLWRKLSPVLTPRTRARLDKLIAQAGKCLAATGSRDARLKQSLGWPLEMFLEGLALVDAFDRSWANYHAAALAESKATPGKNPALDRAVGGMKEAAACLRRLRRTLARLESATGHAPYDGCVLEAYADELEGVGRMMREAARERIGLPYFEKLLNLPDWYNHSNLEQFRVQSGFNAWAVEKNLLPLKLKKAPARTGRGHS